MIITSQFNLVVVIVALTIITLSFAMIENYHHHVLVLIYAQQTTDSDDTNNNIFKLESIPTKKVKVGDIDISYKIFGKGDPILLINGYAGSMYGWDPILLKGLSANHTVTVFDNRGIGNTTVGSKNLSIDQFGADSIGFWMLLRLTNQTS